MYVSSALLCACDCIEVPLQQAKRSAEVVFRGTVAGFHDSGKGYPIVVFRVIRVWKGRVTQEFEMLGYSGDRCHAFPPASLKTGNELLVFAHRIEPQGEYLPIQCFTKLFKDVKDIGKLGAGSKPTPKQTATAN